MEELLTDGNDYHLITNACHMTKDIQGIVCEVGTYMGGGLKLCIDTFASFGQTKERVFVGIDPYGNLPYAHTGMISITNAYTNSARNKFLSKMFELCHRLDANFIFFNLTDDQFFKRFSDGIPVYDDNERILTEYALVIIDGPHELSCVRREFDFFKPRMAVGGVIVFDDIDQYNHSELETEVFSSNFKLIAKSSYKAVYEKTH